MSGYHTPFAAHSCAPLDAPARQGEESSLKGGPVPSTAANARLPLPSGLGSPSAARASTRLGSLLLGEPVAPCCELCVQGQAAGS
jgi:hypothetical protein